MKLNTKDRLDYGEEIQKLVVEEMKEVKEKFDITFFKMNDAETNPSKAHFIKICKEIVEQKIRCSVGM